MIFLRQSTASQEIPLGRFVDSTDGNTEETALSIANTDIKIWKTGATTLADKNSGGATHIANGIYYTVLDATDTDTLGPLQVHVHVTGALSVKQECCVLDEAVYDTVFGTTALSTYAGGDTSGTTTLLTRVTGVVALASALTTVEGKIDIIDGIVDGILVDTEQIGAAGAGLTAVPWNTAWDAEVQSEVTDALQANVSELTTTPAANASLETMIKYAFMRQRNKIEQTSTTQTIYQDDGTTIYEQSTVSDAAGTFTRGEFATA